jgi:hypothetical protein
VSERAVTSFGMVVEVDPGGQQVSRLFQLWLSHGLTLFGSHLAAREWDEAMPHGSGGRLDGWAALEVSDPGSRTILSMDHWDEFVERAGALPARAVLSSRWVGGGYQCGGAMADDPAALTLWVDLPVDWLVDDRFVLRVTQAWLQLAHQCNPISGWFGDGWVTLCAEEAGEVQAWQDSGAFHRIIALRAGGFWLQATKRLAERDGVRAGRVAHALAAAAPVTPRRDRWPRPTTDESTYALATDGLCVSLIDSDYWRWSLWSENGVLCGETHSSRPDSDENAKVLAEMKIIQRTGRRVAEWVPAQHRDGSREYRAVLSTKDDPAN